MREQKDSGPDRMVTFDVSIDPGAQSDPTMGEVFFAVELSTKPKSFMVSMKKTQPELILIIPNVIFTYHRQLTPTA